MSMKESSGKHATLGVGERADATSLLGPRNFGLVNWRGLWTLYQKEVQRFLNVFTQTVLAPVVVTLLFLAIFTLALARQGMAAGFSYAEFLAPGLVVMALLQNSFANTASSMVIAKVQGNIVDVLMPPLSAWELVAGFVGAAASPAGSWWARR